MGHVLVIEDEPSLWQAYQKKLMGWGHTSAWASDAQSAKRAIVDAIMDIEPMPCVAIVDLMLEGSIAAGVEVINLLPNVIQPVVISGYDLAEVRKRLEYPYARVNLYFQKPMDNEDFAVLASAIMRAEGGR
jgi:DNA-binding response OmpR family regulator